MDIYNTKWTRLQASILRFLCMKSGQSINLRGIARALKKSPTAISKAISLLEKSNLIILRKEKNMNLVSVELNINSKKATEFKRVENLRILYESGLIDFLADKFPGSTVILFGSYSRGEDISGDEIISHRSDIDVAIIGAKDKNIDLTKFNKLLERDVVVNFYPSFKEIEKNLRDNILNGILLHGSVDL